MDLEWTDLDVRPMLASGREPFALIMNHLDSLEAGQGLRLMAPFYPEPLIGMLEGQGWSAQAKKSGASDWEILLNRS